MPTNQANWESRSLPSEASRSEFRRRAWNAMMTSRTNPDAMTKHSTATVRMYPTQAMLMPTNVLHMQPARPDDNTTWQDSTPVPRGETGMHMSEI